ncbi:hypothetical protein Pfo_020578 [Paulownia fortunei]|nr:hypothetical protein Pfo_020578 [Paulownia fortunei]
MWTDHGEFQTTVQSVWNKKIRGTEQFILCKKLKALKCPLKQLNLKHFAHISVRASKADQDLKEAQMQLHDLPGNVLLQTTISNCFQQQAKCSYLKNSDRCTKFFHDLVKNNVKRNHISMILKDDNTLTSSQQEVATEFLEFFGKLLGTREECDRIDTNVLLSGLRITDQ